MANDALPGQAACFSAPRLLWSGLEGGAMEQLVSAVRAAGQEAGTAEQREEVEAEAAAQWLRQRRERTGGNGGYALARCGWRNCCICADYHHHSLVVWDLELPHNYYRNLAVYRRHFSNSG